MATLNKSFTIILELLTITTLFAAPSISVEAPTKAYEAPSPDERYAQNLPKSFKEFVTECAKKMATHCSEEVVISLFNATKVSDHCCQKLVEMGYDCHIALVKIFVGLPEAKGYKSTILENGDKVYNECALVVKNKPIAPSPSPSPSPLV